MNKHTPGPWLFCTANEGKCKCHTIMTDDLFIATAHKYGDKELEDAAGCAPGDEDEVQANVRLIAAAPQMAAALPSLLRLLTCPKCVKRGTPECRSSCNQHSFLGPCEEAIAALDVAGVPYA